jgi:hypothetical protein
MRAPIRKAAVAAAFLFSMSIRVENPFPPDWPYRPVTPSVRKA